MSKVLCSRCGTEGDALERPPMPGEIGRQVHAQVCATCWREWLGVQVKLINEYRLSPLDPKHFEFLVEQARAHLNLKAERSHGETP